MTVVWIAGFVPWLLAWRSCRDWSLAPHTLCWALLAWLAWGYVVCLDDAPEANLVALCLTGVAGIAVLGARQPHVMAWNFVVLGLVGVMLLPMVEAWLIGVSSLDGLRRVFLAITLAIGIVNYLPTRLGLGALSLGAGSGLLLYESVSTLGDGHRLAQIAVVIAPLLACLPLLLGSAENSFDRTWRGFRDRYGLIWGQRVREQFNASARNQGWTLRLGWRGIQIADGDGDRRRLDAEVILKALLGRFHAQPNGGREPPDVNIGEKSEGLRPPRDNQ